MFFDDFRTDTFFGLKFDGRQEEVLKEPPFIFVKIIKQMNDFWIFKSSVTEPLANVRPVFAFNVSVIVFVIRS